MEYIPEDVYTTILQNLPKEDYKSFASSSQIAKRSEAQARTLMTNFLDPEIKTAFYEGYHMTGYQTAMLRHLVIEGKNAKYTRIPDFYNLCIIGFLYAIELSKHIPVMLAIKNYDVFVDNVQSNEFLASILNNMDSRKIVINRSTQDDRFIIDLNFVYSTGSKSDLQLYCIIQSVGFEGIHPLYETVYEHKVWVSVSPYNKETVPKGRACYVYSGNLFDDHYRDVDDLDKAKFPLSVETYDKYDIFICDDPYICEDVFSTLSQLYKKPKMIITNTRESFPDPRVNPIKGYLPLPYKFILDTPQQVIIGWSISLSNVSGLTYAELVVLSSFQPGETGDTSTMKKWLQEISGRKAINVLPNIYRSVQGYTIASSLSPLVVDKSVVDSNDDWVLIDPKQNLTDIPISSNNPYPKEPEIEPEESIIKSNLRFIIENPTARAGTYTVDELKKIARDNNVRIERGDRKVDIAKKLYERL